MPGQILPSVVIVVTLPPPDVSEQFLANLITPVPGARVVSFDVDFINPPD